MSEPTPQTAQAALELPVEAIAPDPDQPRTSFSPDELKELAESIRKNSLIQPIVVTSHPDPAARAATPYMILVGERRWRATRLAELPTIPAIVRTDEISPSERLVLQLAENDERSDLSLLEKALAYQRAQKLSGLSQTAFAKKCGKTEGWISHLIRIAKAQGTLREALEDNLLSNTNTVRIFERLSPETQMRLLQAARRTGESITPWRLQAALEREDPTAQDAADGGPEDAEAEDPEAPSEPDEDHPVERSNETVTIELTYAQLRDLLRFLGARPLSNPKAAADQLVKLLAASAAA